MRVGIVPDFLREKIGAPALPCGDVLRSPDLICGGIADYGNLGDPSKQHGVKNYFALLMKRATMEGFVIFDFVGSLEHAKCERSLMQWYKEGRLKYRSHVVDGLDKAFPSLSLLFNGGNTGKLIVQISKDVK